MLKIEEKVYNFITDKNMIKRGSRIVVALSGGADSVCLLEILSSLSKELDVSLVAAHVNHSIRENAKRDEDFAREFSNKRNIPFYCLTEDVPKVANEEHLSLEEAGRKVRYDFFRKLKEETKSDMIAVAHHKNDRAETVIFNLSRGTSVKGLTGIQAKNDDIIRPLMCLTREEIEGYIQDKNLSFVTDETNLTEDYGRNIIRSSVLPKLEEVSEGALENIIRCADNLEVVEEYLSMMTERAYSAHVVKKDGSLTIRNEISYVHKAIRDRVILEALCEVAGKRKDIGKVQIDSVADLINAESGKRREFIYSLVAIRTAKGVVITTKENEEMALKSGQDYYLWDIASVRIDVERVLKGKEIRVEMPGCELTFNAVSGKNKGEYPIKRYTKWINCDKIKCLCVRNIAPDDYIRIEGDKLKKIKDYLVDIKVPSSVRNKVVVLSDGDNKNEVLWVLSGRLGANAKVDENTKRIVEVSMEMR